MHSLSIGGLEIYLARMAQCVSTQLRRAPVPAEAPVKAVLAAKSG
jgi:hypothetical protein